MDLHEAAWTGDAVRVRELLEHGADVHALDPWGKTPLLVACLCEAPGPEAVAMLREYGADPDHRRGYMSTPRSQAYDRYLLSGVEALGDLPAPDPARTDAGELTEEEMEATIAAVRAIVDRDDPAPAAMLAHYRADADVEPYMWTHDYGRWGDVHLVVPPGHPPQLGHPRHPR